MKQNEIGLFSWLEVWYDQYLVKDAACPQRINIFTIDNPGWGARISLKETCCENKSFSKLSIDITENDWYRCFVEGSKFIGAGGSFNLENILLTFQKWVMECRSNEFKNVEIPEQEIEPKNADLVSWLQRWYDQYCNEDWEHSFGVEINSEPLGWYIKIDLEETHCEGQPFNELNVEKTKDDWYQCSVKRNKFEGQGGPFNLVDILKVFQKWATECQYGSLQ